MKKSLLICFFIIAFFLAAGCINGEKSSTQAHDLIIKQGDATGLVLTDYSFYAFPRNRPYNITNYYNIEEYKDDLPVNDRNVGQMSIWEGNSGRVASVELIKLDSDLKFKNYFDIKINFFKDKKNEKQDVLYADIGYPNIGDSSYYYYAVPQNEPDSAETQLEFARKNYIGLIRVTDNKDRSLDEAIRIAKIIDSRLE